ncbi:MAG: hypothetical protein ACI9F2_000215 [Lysobacterales bacterium]|jgi:uncharacterized protein involved in outer membrane biogenesis
MKLFKKILVFIVVVLVVLFVGRNFFIKAVVGVGAKAVVGLDVKMDKFDLSATKSYLHIEGFTVGNPKGFDDPLMVNIPEVLVDYDLGSFLKGAPHIEELRFKMTEFVIIKNKDGVTNIDSITALAGGDKKDGEDKKNKPKSKKPAPKVTIDKLHLKVGKVIFKDYSSGKEDIKEYNINLDEKHDNIKSIEAVVSLIMFKVLTKTGLASLTNIDLGSLQNVAEGSIGLATDALKSTGSLIKGTGSSVKDSAESLKETGSRIKGLFKRD